MRSRELMLNDVRYGGEFFEGHDIFVGIDVNNSKWALTRCDGTMMSECESSKKQTENGKKATGREQRRLPSQQGACCCTKRGKLQESRGNGRKPKATLTE